MNNKLLKYNPIVGLEIHVELNTKSKMFCSCRNNPNAGLPNSEICPICMGHPGTLPVINKEAVRKVIKTGLALNCQIPEESKFDRKNYFYPDLPKGYQISQYDKPFCKDGFLNIELKETRSPKALGDRVSQKLKKIRIRRVHLEEDTGRLIHERDYSLVDFNRAGIPLMELVTEPDINSAKEARRFAEELQLILRYLGVSDADMEKGQLRVEVNISLLLLKSQIPSTKSLPAKIFKENLGGRANPKSQTPNLKLGTKVEIKNLNSFRAVEKAIEYEIKRQSEVLDKKKKVIQETRGWDDVRGVTVSQREKEEAHDYRYFPEPDLPTLHFDKEFINGIRAEIPELPAQKRERFKREYGLEAKDIEIFVCQKDLSEYFEKVVSEFGPGLSPEKLRYLIRLATNYLVTDVQGLFKGLPFSEKDFKVTAENFAEFVTLIQEGKISSKIAKIVLEEMFKTGADPSNIIEERGLAQITDTTELEEIIKEVISKNQKAVDDYKKGRETALQFLVGQVMSATRGRAKPDTVQKLLKDILKK